MISPPGAYHNDKCIMINPPRAYHNGGVNENLTPATTKLGQGNIFTSVCQEFCPQGGRGCLPQGMLGYTPPDQTPPWDQTHPPGSRSPPDQTPPEQTPPTGKQTAAYGQRAAGTHITETHSCFILLLETHPLDGIYLTVPTFVCVPVMFHVVCCPFLYSVLICILWIRLLSKYLICNFHLLIFIYRAFM